MNGKLVKLDSADCEGSSDEGSDHDNEQHSELKVKPVKASKKGKEAKKTEDEQSNGIENKPQSGPGNKIDKRVFSILKNFQDTTNITSKMLQDLVALLQEESSEKRNATATYVVKRLIRATGADNKETVAKVGSIIRLIIRNVPDVNELDLLDIVERELPVNGQPKKKEETLAAVGQVITASSVLELSQQLSTERELAPIYAKLIGYMKGREYLMCLSNNVIVESFATVPEKRFATDVWPVLKQEISKPVSQLNLHTCDVLLAVHDSYNNILTQDQLMAILWPKKIEYSELFKIYFAAPKMYDRRIYARFGKFLGTADKNAKILESWQNYAYEHRSQNVASKGCIFKVTKHLIISQKNANEQQLIDLFASPLMDFILDELLAAKTTSAKNQKPLTMQFREICQEFECAVILLFENPATGDETKARILSNLLRKRGNLNELATTRRFTETLLNTLKYGGLKILFDLYASLLATPVGMEEPQDNGPRNQLECVSQMQSILQHPELYANKKERWSMLKTILTAGVCHVASGLQPCLPAASILSDSTADRCKTIFIGLLIRSCHGDIKELSKDLRKTVEFLKKFLSKTENANAQRHAPNADQQLAWNVLEKLQHSDDNESNASAQIIEVLILFVGLAQYTSCCQLKIDILNDLMVCRNMKMKEQKMESEEDPSWQEVVTDILLQLLLETAGHWREFTNIIVKSMLPYLEQVHLTQILQRLDMDSNPLGEDENESSSDENENENENEGEGESNDDDDDSSADDDDNSEDEDEDAATLEDNALEKLRDDVRQALQNGDDGASEASSVDWNDVAEESGKRLDESLAAIFKMRSQASQRKKRPTKSDRIHSTTLLHFRVRVLDLVEVFANKKPTMNVILDVLQCVFQVFCRTINDKDQRPLQHASQKLLAKLVNKEIIFEDAQDRSQIIDAIEELFAATNSALEARQIRGAPNSHELQQQLTMWRDKCFAALITQCSNKDDVENSVAWPLLKQKLNEWLPGRKSKQSLSSFESIFQFKPTWPGVSQLVALLVSHLNLTTHPMKRQIILKLLNAQKNRFKSMLHGQKAVIQGLEKYATDLMESAPAGKVQELRALKQFLNPALWDTKESVSKISKSLEQFLQNENTGKRKSTAGDGAPVSPKKAKQKHSA
ncbi:myb-binding protein 1A [Drosophila pseudoobscura]|uniref:Myb-binding protein 1A n=1 Tax=Drosophila pseudoobscura pseudoobscura TaxID=46245 RepID=A0A6I8UZN8_DROPS|nr:myb-binding protein 1A [Drosophila pseudoobscura]